MRFFEVTMVRLYLSEGDHRLKKILSQLHDDEKVKGVTVFRGICGFGQSGQLHSADLLDLSFDLPIVIEFFDECEKIEKILEHFAEQFKTGHIVAWKAKINQ